MQWDSIKNAHCLYIFIYKLYFNVSKLYQKWKKNSNVRHIYNVFRFRGIFFNLHSKFVLHPHIKAKMAGTIILSKEINKGKGKFKGKH